MYTEGISVLIVYAVRENVLNAFQGEMRVPKKQNLPADQCPGHAASLTQTSSFPQSNARLHSALVSSVIDALRHRASRWVLAQPASAVIDAAWCGPVESTAL